MSGVAVIIGGLNPEEVMTDTWGHLAPNPHRAYRGHVIVALGCHGDIVVIDYDLDGLPGSPWLADDLTQLAIDLTETVEPGTILRWEGAYRRSKTSGARFTGEARQVQA